MSARLSIPRESLAEFCRRNRIRRLSVFGSVLREDFSPDSDVAVLVEFAPGAGVGLFKLYDLEQELSRLFGGRRAEINTPQSLSRYFRDDDLAEAEVQYVQT